MGNAGDIALVVGTILGVVILCFAFMAILIGTVMRRLSARGEQGLEAEVGGRRAQRRENANTLGRLSRGRGQVRGNGTLGLYDDEVVFVQWVPQRTDRIPRDAITKVDTPRAFLGKTYGRKLLAIAWRTPEGEEDRMAWVVKDLDGWLNALGAPAAP